MAVDTKEMIAWAEEAILADSSFETLLIDPLTKARGVVAMITTIFTTFRAATKAITSIENKADADDAQEAFKAAKNAMVNATIPLRKDLCGLKAALRKLERACKAASWKRVRKTIQKQQRPRREWQCSRKCIMSIKGVRRLSGSE